MNREAALKVIYQLIEQAMSNGQFKKIEQLQIALQAYNTLKAEKPKDGD